MFCSGERRVTSIGKRLHNPRRRNCGVSRVCHVAGTIAMFATNFGSLAIEFQRRKIKVIRCNVCWSVDFHEFGADFTRDLENILGCAMKPPLTASPKDQVP